MELQLDLQLIFKHAVDPLFKHVLAHAVVKLMFKRFVFEVEFDLVTAVITTIRLQLDQIEVHFDGAFWDWLGLMGFREFYLVLQDICVFLNKEHLIDVDFGPIVDNSFDYS
jgi:hypothetical protein